MIFTKLHGLGNDFIALDGRETPGADYTDLARRLCDRHTGVGADGLLIAENSAAADMKMRIVNSDGSEAEMCGNGIRCFVKWLYEHGILKKDEMTIETGAGIIRPALFTENGRVVKTRVDMGEPLPERERIPAEGTGVCVDQPLTAAGKTVTVTSLRLGVPHTVIFTDDLYAKEWEAVGPAVERHPFYPEGTNVNFVRQTAPDAVEIRTWERGCGWTLACGTGSCSAAVACVLTKRTGRRVAVLPALGTLEIEWAENNHVYMTGPAEEVFTGEISL